MEFRIYDNKNFDLRKIKKHYDRILDINTKIIYLRWLQKEINDNKLDETLNYNSKDEKNIFKYEEKIKSENPKKIIDFSHEMEFYISDVNNSESNKLIIVDKTYEEIEIFIKNELDFWESQNESKQVIESDSKPIKPKHNNEKSNKDNINKEKYTEEQINSLKEKLKYTLFDNLEVLMFAIELFSKRGMKFNRQEFIVKINDKYVTLIITDETIQIWNRIKESFDNLKGNKKNQAINLLLHHFNEVDLISDFQNYNSKNTKLLKELIKNGKTYIENENDIAIELNRLQNKEIKPIQWLKNKDQLLKLFNLLSDRNADYIPKYNKNEILVHFIDEKGKPFLKTTNTEIEILHWKKTDVAFWQLVNLLVDNKLTQKNKKYKTFISHFNNQFFEEFKNPAQSRYFNKEFNTPDSRLTEIINQII